MKDKVEIADRIQRFNAALSDETFTFDEDNLGAYLHDDEGNRIGRLSGYFVECVNALPPEHLAEILKTVFLARIGRDEESFRDGKRAGRRELVDTVHELLGIDKLVESLAVIETAMRES